MISRFCSLFLLITCYVVLGQGRQSLSSSVEESGGIYTFTFKNVGSSPLVAYVLVGSKSTPGRSRDTVSIFDSAMEPHNSTAGKELQPGESQTFRFEPTLKPGELFSARVAAAIYADGQMEGERKYLDDLMERRNIILRDLITAEQLLSRAVAEKTPIESVLDSFRQIKISNTLAGRNTANERAWSAVPDQVLSLLENVRVGDQLAPPSTRLEFALKHIREVTARLRNSKPALQ